MNDFRSLQQYYYHQVSVGPHEERTKELVLSDCVLHLPVLEWFASQCRHVTEFGVRDGHSTVALAAGVGEHGQLHSYDIEESPFVRKFLDMTKPCAWFFHLGDTGSPETFVEETDMLFIDTLHTYFHVWKELAHHGRKARKFLAFHDTFTCGEQDVSGPNPKARGIMPAIHEFLERYPREYRTVYRTDWSNGLWVLERQF